MSAEKNEGQTEILMPALSAGMEEGKIARWLKQPGEAVAVGEIIAEIESDKAMMELASESAGVLHAIVAQIGDTVPVNGVIATLLVQNGAQEVVEHAESNSHATAAMDEAFETSRAAIGAAEEGGRSHQAERAPASPLARRLASASGVSLAALKGSGPGGRIVRVDVEKAPEAEPETAHAAASDLSAAGYRDLPHSTTRKTIARRLADAKANIPHFYLHADCELDALLELRSRLNANSQSDKLSINDFVIKAAAVALRTVPEVNVSWSDESMRVYDQINVAVAVSTPTGLITPILRDADSKSLAEISQEARHLTARARANKLQPADYQGSGVTISNLGMYGVQSFSAIINPPQSCILAIGAAARRPVVRGDACVPATLMSCTLSFDHRSVDGVLGARYLGSFKALLEQPERLTGDKSSALGSPNNARQ